MRAAGATLLVAWLPHPIEWQSTALSELLERHDAAPGSFESARARRRILDLCAESELPCLDLADSLLLAGRDRAALITYDPARPWDWTATERGIEVLLESLSQRLAPLLQRNHSPTRPEGATDAPRRPFSRGPPNRGRPR